MVNKFKQLCSTLTYRDMVDLSTMISEALPEHATPEGVAQVLLELPIDTEDNQIQQTNMILTSSFGRKRQIIVQPMQGDVFKITCPSFEGAVVFDKNIREGVSQLLDTITVLKAME